MTDTATLLLDTIRDISRLGDTRDDHVRHAVRIARLRADLADIHAELCDRIAAESPERRFDVDGYGRVEIRTSTRRTRWDHDTLLAHVVARLVDTPGVVWDPDTGERIPAPNAARNIADGIRASISLGAGKLRGLETLGLDADEYCQADEARPSIAFLGSAVR